MCEFRVDLAIYARFWSLNERILKRRPEHFFYLRKPLL